MALALCGSMDRTTAETSDQEVAAPRPVTSRADLAQALMRFEHALRLAIVNAERIDEAADGADDAVARGARDALLRDANARFDGLTLSFFSGQLDVARERLDELSADVLRLDGAARDRFRSLCRVRLRCVPRFLDASTGGEVRVELVSDHSEVLPMRAAFRGAAAPLPCAFDEHGVARVQFPPAERGQRWSLILDDLVEPGIVVDQLPMEPAVLRQITETRLAQLDAVSAPSAPGGNRALETTGGASTADPASRVLLGSRARLLLSMLAAEDEGVPRRRARLTERVVDASALAYELESQFAVLDAGGEPCHLAGDRSWREVSVDGVTIPMRVAGAAGRSITGGQPLIIALHGAGGDENMFMESYGDGCIHWLAMDNDAIVVAPLTTIFATSPRFFDAIVDEMVRCFAVDRRRVVILGHSMGAAAVASTVNARADAIAAAAMIAGGGAITAREGRLPPLRIDGGERDPLISAARLEQQATALLARGVVIEYAMHAGRGHTLLVGEVLPEVIAWLLAQPPAP